jgi:glyoxylase-like metal-dependent hydrolase (beta-lactamase superfamily II)
MGRDVQSRASEIASNVYVLKMGRGPLSSNVYLVRSESSWALVDAGWSGSEQKIQAAADSVFGPGARPESMLLTHLHPEHSGATRQLAERWQQPAYLHPRELPLAAGYLPEYAIPLDRWLMPLIGRLPTKTQRRIAANAGLRSEGRYSRAARLGGHPHSGSHARPLQPVQEK